METIKQQDQVSESFPQYKCDTCGVIREFPENMLAYVFEDLDYQITAYCLKCKKFTKFYQEDIVVPEEEVCEI